MLPSGDHEGQRSSFGSLVSSGPVRVNREDVRLGAVPIAVEGDLAVRLEGDSGGRLQRHEAGSDCQRENAHRDEVIGCRSQR